MRRRRVAVLVLAVLVGWVGRGLASHTASQTLIPQFQNDAVTVWKTILAPHEALGMHRHDHGRVVVALKGGTLALPQDDGTSRTLVLETGKAYWLPADPPARLHGDANRSDTPLEMMVVEMKR
jgi:hypothetical protein